MRIIKILILILLSIGWFACDKKLNISEFKDEFGDYQPELKIEGHLKLHKPGESIIRIIKTSVITDNNLYNGIDDDGDGEIDDYDEIIAFVQDTSAKVKVINLNSGDETYFNYVAVADSFIKYDEDDDGINEDEITYVSYGGYKPNPDFFHIESNTRYQLEIYSQEFDKTITGVTTVYPPVEFIDTLFVFRDSIVTMNFTGNKQIFWKSDLNVTSYYISFELLEQDDQNQWQSTFLYSHPSARDNDLTARYTNVSVGREIIFGSFYDAVLKMTVEALSPEYGSYMFSSLPLKDPARSNLRDENGNPVMGCFGATSAKNLYIVFDD